MRVDLSDRRLTGLGDRYVERHRLYQYAWFWAIPAIAYFQDLVRILAGAEIGPAGMPPWIAFLMPILFVAAFAPMGYRVIVDDRGIRVRGLGFALYLQLIYWPLFKAASASPEEIESVEVKQKRGLLRFISWPMLPFRTKGKHFFGFGTREVLVILRRGRGDLKVGIRDSASVLRALGMSPIDAPVTAAAPNPTPS